MKRWLLFLAPFLVVTVDASAQVTQVSVPVMIGPAGTPVLRPVGPPVPVDPKLVALKLERQAAIGDMVSSDAGGLRLGENRAVAFARSGALTWKHDQKTAQGLFQRAINELANAQTMAETEGRGKPNQQMNENRITQSVRPAVLNVIANYDPEAALEAMYRTRTASLQRAMAGVEPSGKITDVTGMNASMVRSEMSLEQHLMMMSAEKNPERAIKLLQDSLKKGVSNESLNLLKKLYTKDPESATSLAGDALDKLASSNFSSDPGEFENVMIATSFLQDAMRAKKPGAKELIFDDGKIRSLAQRLINFSLTDQRLGMSRISQVLPIAERYSPGSVAALKKAQASSMPPATRAMTDPDIRRMMTDPKVTPAEMMQQAKSMAPDMRPTIYQNAAAKMAQTGDITGAVQTLNANFSGAALENAINSANSSYANYLIQQGKFSDAEQLIDSLPDQQKRQGLMNLATRAFQKDQVENKTLALGILTKVRGMLPDRPEDNNDLSMFMQLINTYATISADEAFSTYEPLIPQLNELADANAVVQSFQNNYAVRSGEFLIAQGGYGNFGFQVDPNVLRSLAKADYDRTLKLLDMFSRREIRIMLKLQLAENLLQ